MRLQGEGIGDATPLRPGEECPATNTSTRPADRPIVGEAKVLDKTEPIPPESRGPRCAQLEDLARRFGDGRRTPGELARRSRPWRKAIAWRLALAARARAKRIIDVSVAVAALIALSPLFLATALLIKLTDRGPLLFWQTRVGRWGREFACPKFRSMVPNAERLQADLLARNDHATGVTFKMKRDPRVTPVGRLIRKLSIDELPQLWCVVRGEMSLVGPRPPLPKEVACYTQADRRRLDAIPGLTCIWQVSGRGDLPFDRQVELDVEYIHRRSLLLDLKLLLKTIPAVIAGRGAY